MGSGAGGDDPEARRPGRGAWGGKDLVVEDVWSSSWPGMVLGGNTGLGLGLALQELGWVAGLEVADLVLEDDWPGAGVGVGRLPCPAGG